MAVTKRTRFEIFRRDNNACRYCGQTAPEVRITIDHVLPTALGGTDDPTNLVTACFDCNLGKSSTSPSETLVADVAQDALRYAQLTKAAWAIRVEAIEAADQYIADMGEAADFPKPKGWRTTMRHFYGLGVPYEALMEAIEVTSDRHSENALADPFKYMCGIVWNYCREVGAAVRESVDMDGCWYTEDQIEEIAHDAFKSGWDKGRDEGRRAGWVRGMKSPDPITRLLHNAVEGTYAEARRDIRSATEVMASCG